MEATDPNRTPLGDGHPLLTATAVTVGYEARDVLAGLSLEVRAGELTALIGPNGAGKTTLLHALAGILALSGGGVCLRDRDLASMSRREVAREIALVPQFSEIGFDVKVAEAVALGRYPWVGPIAPLSSRDDQAVETALEALDLVSLRDRSLNTLSGGERQRVLLARSWAQDAPIFLLDEPVSNLDLRYQYETYQHLRQLSHDRGRGILVADHHLNLIAAFCDRIIVLHEGCVWGDGAPAEIVNAEMLETVFRAPMEILATSGNRPQCVWGTVDS